MRLPGLLKFRFRYLKALALSYLILQFYQLLDADLLCPGLPDLVWHPGRGALGLVHLHSLALEEMHLLGASLAEFDVRVAPVGRFQGRLAGRFAGEEAYLVLSLRRNSG